MSASITNTCLAIVLSASMTMLSQVAPAQDTSRAISFSGYGEVYYCFDFNRPKSNERPPFVYTHNRNNEINVNLAFLKGTYSHKRARANVALAAGTYMNAVYAAELGVLKNIYEANAGVKLSKNQDLWLDAGVLPSHIGFESAVATDCKTLTRSLVAENSPYYESGARMSYRPANKKWYFAALLLNGWQRIQRPHGNTTMGAGSQITYSPTDKLSLNYSTFAGNEQPDSLKKYRTFHNVYGTIQLTSKVSLTAGIDYGMEQRAKGSATWNNWMGTCLIIQYKSGGKWALAARGEYYQDDSSVIVVPGVPGGFRTLGFSANFDYNVTKHILWRVEGKTYASETAIFLTGDGSRVTTSPAATTSLCVHF